jgi:catechol 2,3-dioxygenase-like lactoylglutathione lyase family enzyme
MNVQQIDHLVLTVRNIEATCDFYARVLGMDVVTFDDRRIALAFGTQRINLHEQGHEFEPKAAHPTPGSADLCFLTRVPLAEVIARLHECGIAPLLGPVPRTGASGPMNSVYFRDPDLNLIEVANLTVSPYFPNP